MALNSNAPPNLNDLSMNEFKTIYPLYINSNRTQQQGRRIGKEKAVPDPNVQEIEQALSKINGVRIIVEMNKRHPREIFFEQAQFLGELLFDCYGFRSYQGLFTKKFLVKTFTVRP